MGSIYEVNSAGTQFWTKSEHSQLMPTDILNAT